MKVYVVINNNQRDFVHKVFKSMKDAEAYCADKNSNKDQWGYFGYVEAEVI